MSRSRPRLPDPLDVLSGRIRASIEQLFALVHEVNPTDQPIPAKERAARYALKSRLQSLLIRQHADALDVKLTADGVVSLHHRHDGRDAAHAVIAELEDDARQWVETRLALGAPPVASRAAPVVDAPKGDLLDAGREALADYDYDGARAAFEAALERPGMAVEAARALVDLLVNHLGDDEGALALQSSFSARLLSDDEVRLGLALAAARLGQREPAARLGRGLADLDLYTRLADLALRDRDLVEAARLLHTLRERTPGSPAVLRLTSALASAREQERQPEEEAILRAEAEGELELALTLSRRLAAQFPDSSVARRVVAAHEAKERRAEAARVAQTAWQAYQRGDATAAAALAQRARALCPDDAELLAWLEEARDAANEAAEMAMLQHAQAEASGGRYGAWLGLDAAQRGTLRARLDRPGLRWLDLLTPSKESAAAVEALERAIAEPARAFELLKPHLATLRPIPEARECWRAAEARAVDEARARFEAGIAACEQDGLDRAIGAAKLLVPVDDEQRERARVLQARLVEQRRRRDDIAEVEQLAARGDLLHARDRARAAGLEQRAIELAQTARKAFAVEVLREEAVPFEDIRTPEPQPGPLYWLTENGERLVLASTVFGELCVRVIDVREREVRWAAMLTLPRPYTGSFHEVRGDVLTIVGAEGWLLQLSLSEAELLHFRFPAPGQERVLGMCVSADGNHVWLSLGGPNPRCHVVDLGDSRRGRGQSMPGYAISVRGGTEIARVAPRGGLQFHAPNGNERGPWQVEAFFPDKVIDAPGGRSLLAFGDIRHVAAATFVRPEERHPGARAPMGICLLRDGMCRFGGMKDVDAGTAITVAALSFANRVVIVHPAGELTRVVISTFDEGGGLGEAATFHTVRNATLVQDVRCSTAVLLSYTEDGTTFAPLEIDPPEAAAGAEQDQPVSTESIEAQSRRFELPLGGIELPFGCAIPGDRILGDGFDEVNECLRQREWANALSALPTGGPGTQHALHVEALCRLRLGDRVGARSALARARGLSMGCHLEHVAELLDALDGTRGTVLGDYVGFLAAADAHRAQGRFREAIEAASQGWAWRARERQGLMRVVANWLDHSPETGAQRFHRRLSLATLCDVEARGLGVDLPLGEHHWDEARFHDLAARARRALAAV